MARVYIRAGQFYQPDIDRVIEHTSADEAAVEEFLKRLHQRGEVSAQQENAIRQLACSARFGHLYNRHLVGPKEEKIPITLGGIHYKIYAWVKIPAPEPTEDEVEKPDMELRAQTLLPGGKYDNANSISVRTYNFTSPDWLRN